MAERHDLSRELAEDEVPGEANEDLEEARAVHRRPRVSGRRSGGSEEKAGIEERAGETPAMEARPEIKPPPLEPRKE
jgi:hypothetical protein